MAEDLRNKYSSRIIYSGGKTDSFKVKKDKILLIQNYDLEEGIFIRFYKDIQLNNFYVISTNSGMICERILIPDNYLIHIDLYKNFILVIGVNDHINVKKL